MFDRERRGVSSRLYGGLIVTFVLVLPAIAAVPPCTHDPGTGIPLPGTGSGLCVEDTESSLRLVQRTGDGLLIVVPDAEPYDRAFVEPDGTRSLRLRDRNALLIFCPDAAVGVDGGQDCLTDFPGLVPGPAALLGFGTVQSAAVAMHSGSVSCPASIHAVGLLRDVQGNRFDFRSSLTIAEVASDCAVTFGEARLEGTLRSGPQTADPDEPLDLAAALTRLDSEQWRLLEELLALDPTGVAALERLWGTGAQVTGGICLGLNPFSNECLRERIDAVHNRADTIQDRVDAIKDDLIDRRPSLRDLVDQVDTGQLARLFQQVNAEIQGFLELVEYLRDGFTWGNEPCDQTPECSSFKQDVEALIDDMEDVVDFVISTDCLISPSREERGLRALEGTPDRLRDLLDRVPPVVLFTLDMVLDRIVPEPVDPGFQSGVGSWRTMFRDVMDNIPESLRNEIAAACGEDPLLEPGGDPIPCRILRPPATEKALKLAKPAGKLVALLTKLANKMYTPDDLELTVEGVIAAGGGAGGQTPNPIKAVLEIMESVGAKLGGDKAESFLEKLTDMRDDCLDTDKDIEEDLRECEGRTSYLLSYRPFTPSPVPYVRPTYQQVVDHVDRLVEDIALCKLAGGCAGSNLPAAQTLLVRARARDNTRKGFEFLCDAYCELADGRECNKATASPFSRR